MKRFWIGCVAVAIAVGHGFGQKIETANSDRSQIMHLRTALNHLTVIEVGEPVVQVAAGSPSFKVEWRENKVFVQPTEADVSTNLFIWTSSQRLNYELEAAGAVSHMDFAVDQAAPQPVHPRPASTTPPQPSQTAILRVIFITAVERVVPNGPAGFISCACSTRRDGHGGRKHGVRILQPARRILRYALA